jgi:nucleoside-diphosphate-sugar epimerase
MTGAGRRALVTGATGFVGGRLAAYLVDRGWTVTAVIRTSSDRSLLPAGVTPVPHDGTTEDLVGIVKRAAPDVVFHLASKFVAEHSADAVTSLIESNVLFGAQLLEAMDAGGCRSLVDASTSWLHYQDSDYDPVSLYAATKRAFHDIALFYVNARGFSMATLELSDTYGPGDRRRKLFTVLQEAVENGGTLAMTPGEQLVDLVFVDDVVRAFEMAANRVTRGSATSESFVLSSGEPVSLRRVVAAWAEGSSSVLNIDWGGRPYRSREMMTPFSGGNGLPGWEPAVGLVEGLRRLRGDADDPHERS